MNGNAGGFQDRGSPPFWKAFSRVMVLLQPPAYAFVLLFLLLFSSSGFAQPDNNYNIVILLGKVRLKFLDTISFNNQTLTDISSLCLSGSCITEWNDAGVAPNMSITAQDGVTASPNPITDVGTISFDTAWGDARYILNQSYDNPAFINSLNWPKLSWFPDPCPGGQAITYLGTIPTCTAFLQSYTETDPKFLAENSSIYAAIALRLNTTDQRYNDTVLIGTKLDASDQRYNETILIASKLDATDQRYNDTAWVLLQNYHSGLLGWGNITGFIQPDVNWSKVKNVSIVNTDFVAGVFSRITGIGVQTQTLNMGNYSLINATNVNATRFNGKLDCSNIDGGSDGDYCADATGVGGSAPSQWLNSSTLIYLNSSYPQTVNMTTLNATIINQNGSSVISAIVAGAPITVTGSATNKTIDISLPTCSGTDKYTSADGNTVTCATDQTGGAGGGAPWEGVLHTNIGDGNPTSTLVLHHNTVETVAGPTPTGIGATVGRLQNFKYKTAITINNMSYHGVGTVSGIYTAAIYNSSGARQWTAVINTTASTWTTIRISPAVTIPANTQMWFGIGATTTGTTAGFRTPVSPIASSLGLTTTPARLQENSIIYRQVALTAGAWPASLPSLSAAAFASAGTTGTIPIIFFQSN